MAVVRLLVATASALLLVPSYGEDVVGDDLTAAVMVKCSVPLVRTT